MRDLARLEQLLLDVDSACERLAITKKTTELESLRKASAATDFWQQQSKAQATMQQIARLEQEVEPWQALQKDAQDCRELTELQDASLTQELEQQINSLEKRFEELKSVLKFSGPYDSFDAILSIHAGAGGTDAQDWAQMLLRMYVRFAEKHSLAVSMIEESSGEEAGLKSVTLEIRGQYVFAKLKGEHGVHRLVRLSPFNADALRQTSFAKVEVMPKIDQPETVQIDEKDLKIDVYRSGGKGGQSVNTTDSAVRITHLPTGIVVAIQNERSQLQNKETAMTILRSRLAQLQIEQHAADVAELKGPNQSAEWGNQIRSYVLHPYKMVKDLRTKHETSDTDAVLDGDLDPFIDAYLEHTM